MTTPQAAAQIGRFPSKWNYSSPMMTAMPADHCILATGQTWQPQCLGRREVSHGLLLDALVLALVTCSRSHIRDQTHTEKDLPQESRCRLELWQEQARFMHLLQGLLGFFSDKPFSALDLRFP